MCVLAVELRLSSNRGTYFMRIFLAFLSISLLFLTAFPVHAGQPNPEEVKRSLEFMATRQVEMTPENKKVLERIENYLTGLTTVMADFIQVAPSGDIAVGKFYMMRPGKLRLQYEPPTPILMVTSGKFLVYYDYELQQVNYIDMDDTLVGFLARKEVKFDETVKVVDLKIANNSLRVTLLQSERPKDGMLTLELSDGPLQLRNMIVTDSAGQMTTVSLNNAKFGIQLDSELFVFKDPNLGGIRKNKNLPQ